MSYHTAEVGDSSILVGIGVKQHLGVGVDGYVCLDTFLVLAQELGDCLDFRLRLRERTTVGVITGVRRGTLVWGRKGGKHTLSSRCEGMVHSFDHISFKSQCSCFCMLCVTDSVTQISGGILCNQTHHTISLSSFCSHPLPGSGTYDFWTVFSSRTDPTRENDDAADAH